MGFTEAKRRVLNALKSGLFQHAVRDAIDEKNLLHTGEVSTEEVIGIINKCNGTHHTQSPHHMISNIAVHVLKRDGWYIKFYFIESGTNEAGTFFLSVHR